ncbi:MAG: SGNH/GDSL hydrolase family protein [Algibacter sp.]|uniref:SGNH/GDSL hydrolase family protein n=1 Tax=Algibacter sp. TaxID=1872428 RepID=UPI0032972CF5
MKDSRKTNKNALCNYRPHRFIKLLSTIVCCWCVAYNTYSQNNVVDSLRKEENIHKILFIGNDVISTNDLPALVKQKAKYSGYTVETKTISKSNYNYADHWNKSDVQNLIRSKLYDIVIIQQNPTNRLNSYKKLVEYSEKYSALCKENNVVLAFFMVWPSLEHYITIDTEILNYQLIAETNNDVLCPIGEVWKTYFDKTNRYDYYDSDNFLPSKKGSDVAAQVVLKSILKYLR